MAEIREVRVVAVVTGFDKLSPIIEKLQKKLEGFRITQLKIQRLHDRAKRPLDRYKAAVELTNEKFMQAKRVQEEHAKKVKEATQAVEQSKKVAEESRSTWDTLVDTLRGLSTTFRTLAYACFRFYWVWISVLLTIWGCLLYTSPSPRDRG